MWQCMLWQITFNLTLAWPESISENCFYWKIPTTRKFLPNTHTWDGYTWMKMTKSLSYQSTLFWEQMIACWLPWRSCSQIHEIWLGADVTWSRDRSFVSVPCCQLNCRLRGLIRARRPWSSGHSNGRSGRCLRRVKEQLSRSPEGWYETALPCWLV